MYIVVEPLVWLFFEILMIPVHIALWIAKWLFVGLVYALGKLVPFIWDLIVSLVKFIAKQVHRLISYCWNSFKEYLQRKKEEKQYVFPYEDKRLDKNDASISKW